MLFQFLKLDTASFHGGDLVATWWRLFCFAKAWEFDMTSQRPAKRAIDELRPRDKHYVCHDIPLAGFGVKIYPFGRKSFIVEYRPGAGGRRVARKRVVIGKFGTMTCEHVMRVES